MNHFFKAQLLPICLCFIGVSLSAPSMLYAEKKIHVAASILPQKYFIQKIGGDRVKVSVMVLPGANPATYEPKPSQMVNLSNASIYFAIGVPFEENWLSRFAEASPHMRIVETQSGITKIPMKASGHRHHESLHDPEETTVDTKDPHIWLSPPLVMLQAKNILDALTDTDPKNRTVYDANYSKFIHELKVLDGEIKRILQTTGHQAKFMVYHPSWGYFAKTYGLEQIPIELEGKKPSPRKLLELIQKAQQENIKVIFVQPQFSEKSAESIASAIGGKVMFADPLAEDWKNNLLQVAETFRSSMQSER
ncbi:MAG: zinc ABC transporter substrate-binding protein [Deltaproteobacteria bacterium]|nr:zinc ABC transporter substrate-binding protein [Deltaproteobacteria bacterium]